jgi:hypothetical protein
MRPGSWQPENVPDADRRRNGRTVPHIQRHRPGARGGLVHQDDLPCRAALHQGHGTGRTDGADTDDPDFRFGYLALQRSTRYFTSVRYSSASAELIRRDSFPVHPNMPRNSLAVNLSVLSLFIATSWLVNRACDIP